MKRILFLAFLFVLSICLFAAAKKPKPPETIATVDGRIINAASLDSTIRQIQKNYPLDTPTDSLKSSALDSLVTHELINIRRDSIKKNLDNSWDFTHKRQNDIDQTVMKVLFDKQIAARIKVDSSEVVKYYDENKDKFMEPEQVKASHILIRRPKADTAEAKTEAKKKKMLQEADDFAKKRAIAVYEKAMAGDNWDSLAAKYSEDASNASKGGDLGYFQHGRMVAEFDSVAFKSAPGTIVGPISTKFGYHVIKVVDHKMPLPRAIDATLEDEIKSGIIETKQKDAASAYLDSLKQKATYVYNDEMLAKDDSLVDPKAWMLIVSGTDTIYDAVIKETLPRYVQWKKLTVVTPQDKKDMLEVMSTGYLLRHTARELGVMNDPEVVRAYDEATNIEANLRISRLVNDTSYDPTEDEITNYFNTHQEKYHESRPLLVHHIIFQDSLLAATIRDSIIAGADFATMAKRYYPGEPEIREVAYNLDYIGPDDMGRDFYAIADTLKVGAVSMPVKTSWGYHLIKLVNRRQDKTLDQVRPGIRQLLKDSRNAKRTDELVSSWKQAATIKINNKALKKFKPSEKKVIHIESASSKKNGG